MTRIVLVRHGQTMWNKEMIFRGRMDLDLGQIGIEQVNLLAQALNKMQIDVIYSSPLKRALNTAIPIANYHHLEPSIDDRFIDINYGAWQGKSRNEIKEGLEELYLK